MSFVGNPENRFSGVEAQMNLLLYDILLRTRQVTVVPSGGHKNSSWPRGYKN